MLPLSGWSPIQSSLQLCGLQWMADRLWWLTVAGRFLPPNGSRFTRYKYASHTSSPVTPRVKPRISSMFTASSAVIALLLMTTGRALAQDSEQQGNPGGCETLLERREWSVIYLWGFQLSDIIMQESVERCREIRLYQRRQVPPDASFQRPQSHSGEVAI